MTEDRGCVMGRWLPWMCGWLLAVSTARVASAQTIVEPPPFQPEPVSPERLKAALEPPVEPKLELVEPDVLPPPPPPPGFKPAAMRVTAPAPAAPAVRASRPLSPAAPAVRA